MLILWFILFRMPFADDTNQKSVIECIELSEQQMESVEETENRGGPTHINENRTLEQQCDDVVESINKG